MNRGHYLISLLIVIVAFGAFAWRFEKKKPRTREMVLVSVLTTLAVAGRVAFFMLPEFKPTASLVIITGVCFGKETGFLVGALSALVSNFFFGQGPWTPWQMLAFGMLGFCAGLLFCRKKKVVEKKLLCLYGFLSVLIIYGGIVNPASLLMYSNEITKEALISVFATGFPYDLLHAGFTAICLWGISDVMREKLERIKRKYGMLYNN